MTDVRARRVVVLVPNPATHYSRGTRIARSLAECGYEVEIAAVAARGLPREERDGDVLLRRYSPGPTKDLPVALTAYQRTAAAGTNGRAGDDPRSSDVQPDRTERRSAPGGRRPGLIGSLRFVAGRTRRQYHRIRRTLSWPHATRGWWKSLAADLPPADVYHAIGINTLGGAVALGEAARRKGRAGAVIYDVVDLATESHLRQDLPRLALRMIRRRELRWVRRTQAVVTVNDRLAEHLERSFQLRTRPTVLLNCPPSVRLEDPPEPLIRKAAGIPPERRTVLFLGKLGPSRGLEAAEEAILKVPDAALVMMGFGSWQGSLAERDKDGRFEGRHFTLPAVPADEVPRWAASADVSLIPVSAISLNHRYSTPNKLWESISGGTPVVVSRDLDVMAELVEREGLGATFEGSSAAAMAGGLRRMLDLPDEERATLRRRILDAARDRYHWDAAVQPYLALVRRLVP